MQRKGEELAGETRLAVGDTLLLQGSWSALDQHLDDRDVLVVDRPELVRRQAVPLGRGSKRAIAVLAGMVILLATGAVPPAVAGLLAAPSFFRGTGPRVLLLGLVVLVFVLGQLISNLATALIVIPIAVFAAGELDVSSKPLLVAVSVAAAAAFLTPVATPANRMVMGPGGYRFGDYRKLGLPLLVLFGVVAVLLVPVFWSF